MHLFTVLTPTYNRKKLLKRVYDSLKRQTFKDFVWLIIDDGSTDGTSEVVDIWKKENVIEIEYYYKENEGKHIILKLGFDLIKTKYMLDIDDDDELTDDCLQVFYEEWMKLEKENNTNIGSIRALVIDENNKILGSYNSNTDIGILDISYNDMNFVRHKHFENITSNKTEIIKNANIFVDDGKWLYDKIKNINPGIFWMRLSRKTSTRYLFRPLRIYHYDAPYSILRVKSNFQQKWFNRTFTILQELNEMSDYYWRYPIFFLNQYCHFLVYSSALKLPFKDVYDALVHPFFKYMCIVFYPASSLLGSYLRKKYK